MTTLTQADDAICSAFNSQWQATGLEVEWPGERPDGPKLFDGDAEWARLTIQLTGSRQTTFGPVGSRRFERTGLATAQVFAKAGERGLERARELCTYAVNAFEGRSVDGVRFVQVEPKDVGPDGHWYQMNVVVAFEFEEVK